MFLSKTLCFDILGFNVKTQCLVPVVHRLILLVDCPPQADIFYDSRHQVRWEITIFKGFSNDFVPEIPKNFRLRRAFIRKLSVFPPFPLISKILDLKSLISKIFQMEGVSTYKVNP